MGTFPHRVYAPVDGANALQVTPGYSRSMEPVSGHLALVHCGAGFAAPHPLVTRWRSYMRAGNRSETTIDARIGLLSRVTRHVGHDDPTTLTDDHVLDYLAQPFAPSTRQTYHAGLSAWFKWLVMQGVRPDNPMLLLSTPRVPRGRPKPITTDQLGRLLDSRMHRRTRTMILLAAYQGFRACEIATIRGADVDVRSGTLQVLGKGGVDAELPLHPVIAAEASEYGPGWWFRSWTTNRRSPNGGGPILPRSVSDIVSRAMRRAGVPGTLHCLRHWHASALLAVGVDTRITQELMRHSSMATTERYLAVDDRQRRAALLRLPDVTA